jgi:hypothetical protein
MKPIPQRFLNRTAYDALSTVDKVRAYLLLRTTPVPRRVLQQVSQGPFIAQYLTHDIRQGLVKRPRPGWYALTAKGRKLIAQSLPVGVLGMAIPL